MMVGYFSWVIDIEIDGCDMRRFIFALMLPIIVTLAEPGTEDSRKWCQTSD